MVKTIKPPLTIDQQIKLLKSRGLLINNTDYAKKILSQVNYYRLSAYSSNNHGPSPGVDKANLIFSLHFMPVRATLVVHLRATTRDQTTSPEDSSFLAISPK
jgi:hypothetical protein